MFESKINRGATNGYAPLDGSKLVPYGNIPPIITGVTSTSGVTNYLFSNGNVTNIGLPVALLVMVLLYKMGLLILVVQ